MSSILPDEWHLFLAQHSGRLDKSLYLTSEQKNIIHVRLATASVVEQMNAHPFAKLHTALTHNGETTNYEVLK